MLALNELVCCSELNALAGSLFPAQLSDLLSLPLYISPVFMHPCLGNSLKCQRSFIRIACLFILIFGHKPKLLGCDGNISTLSLSLKRQPGKCVQDGELQQCAGDLWRVTDKFGQDEFLACRGALSPNPEG